MSSAKPTKGTSFGLDLQVGQYKLTLYKSNRSSRLNRKLHKWTYNIWVNTGISSTNDVLIIWNLDICSIAYKRNISIHPSKSTSYAFKHGKQVSECSKCPKVHANLAPVNWKRQPTTDSTNNLQSNLEQHAHHNMKPEKVGPLLSPHDPKVSTKEVRHEKPSWKASDGSKERVC